MGITAALPPMKITPVIIIVGVSSTTGKRDSHNECYFLAAIFVLIAYIGQDPLHCGGELSVTGALSNPTPFCTLAGININC